MNNTTMQNVMYILIEQCKIYGITFLISIPFAFLFFPLAIVIWSIGGILGWVALFNAGFKIMQGQSLDLPMNFSTDGKLTAEDWLEMRKTQDDYNDERREKRNESLKYNASKVAEVVGPKVKKVVRIAILTAGTVICLLVVGSLVALAVH